MQKRVAVIDDEKDILESYQEILGQDYLVLPFENPKDFLSFLDLNKECPFEAVVSDLKMPGMSGIEMLKQAHAKGFQFPAVLLSGHLDKDTAIKAVDLGVYRLLEKPTKPEALISTLAALMQEHEVTVVRKEIRQITNQMRECYTYLRLLVEQHVPDAEDNVLQTNHRGKVVHQESFDSLLTRLEEKLEVLLQSETQLELSTTQKRYNKAS